MSENEPPDPEIYTATNDVRYSRFSGVYDFAVRHTSLYSRWLLPAVQEIRGPRVLEISFGTGWLMTQYARQFDAHGVDLNWNMIGIATRNLRSAALTVPLQQAKVEALPFRGESFDTVVNTMAFSGYPRADRAMSEIRRVLRPDGRLVLVDMNLPEHETWMTRFWLRLFLASGDILRDMGQIFSRHGFIFSDDAIGLSGSLHLYVAEKRQ